MEEDLQGFKGIIEKETAKAEEDVTLLKSAFKNDANNVTDGALSSFKSFDEGSEVMNKEANVQLAIGQKKVLFLVMLLLFANFSYSQSCGFDTERSKLRQNPNYIELEKAAEKRIQDIIKSGNQTNRNANVLTIPVVIHVLHLGEAVGVGSNISDAQIQSSIDNLNDFYRGQTPNSPVDFAVEFVLAKRDPSCNATTGINRVDASSLPGYSDYGVNVQNSNGASYNDIVSLISWPQIDYFNVWIVTELDGNNGGSGFQGYAYFYEEFGNHGSVMMSTVFGYDPGNMNGWGLNSNGDNSTVIHELGHYFHLYHTFQGDDTNDDGVSDTCPADTEVGSTSDGCADTVPHQRGTSACPTQNSCTSANWVDNNTINNIMSYYNCVDRLTSDQRIRVRAAMEGRAIVTSKGAIAPDASASSYAAPVAVCNTNSTSQDAAGITSVKINDVTFTSGSSRNDGGNIDRSTNCSRYFEIDTSVSNTLEVGMFSVNLQQLGIWIDWNDDGDFDDDQEQQYLVNQNIAPNSTVSIPLTYPSSIPYDDYVKIRLVTDIDERYTGATTINSACTTSLVYGQSEDYAIYVKPAASLTWTGTTDTDWETTSNWSTGVAPTLASNVTIPSTPTNQPVIGATTSASVNDLTIDSGASLSVTSGGSLIVNGTSTGTITYNVAIPETNWHLVSSPVVGQSYDDAYVTANSIAISGSGNRAIGMYDNGTPDVTTLHWRYLQAGGNGTFDPGIGYSMLRTEAGNYNFTGTFPTSDVSVSITQNDQNWNLVGNPFPSYLDVSAFLTANASKLSSPYQAIYVWNGSSYAPIGNLSMQNIHPGQGFFVHSNIASGTLSITEAMQSHTTGSFYRNGNGRITLELSDGTNVRRTSVTYLEGKTKGLDPGFDLGMFTGASSSLNVYTQLVDASKTLAFQAQALPNTDIESMIIPVGVKAAANTELSFTAQTMQLPSGIMVYLEDTLTGVFTRLDQANARYDITIDQALEGTGRFFIHASRSDLNKNDLTLENISVFKTNASTLRIVGLPQGEASISIFSVSGKQVLQHTFTAERVQDITLPSLAAGVYITRIQSNQGLVSKKIILQ